MWLPLSTFYISHEALCFGNIGAARKVFPDWFFLTMVIPCFQFLGEASSRGQYSAILNNEKNLVKEKQKPNSKWR